MIRRISKFFRNGWKFIKHGGITVENFIQIKHGDELNGKKVLITGGSSGIGRAIAYKLHSMGASVLITGTDSKKLKSAVEVFNGSMNYLEWNISSEDSFEDKFEEPVSLLGGGVDILINNAGIYKQNGSGSNF